MLVSGERKKKIGVKKRGTIFAVNTVVDENRQTF